MLVLSNELSAFDWKDPGAGPELYSAPRRMSRRRAANVLLPEPASESFASKFVHRPIKPEPSRPQTRGNGRE